MEKYLEIAEIVFAARRDAVGLAYRELDCGCARLCGVSRKGNPVGEVFNLSGQPTTRNLEPLVCLRCYRDKRFAVERTARQGILWADRAERPIRSDERTKIAQAVFGDGYQE